MQLSRFSFVMILLVYLAFAPIGLDLLYNPLIAGPYDSPWPPVYGQVRNFACIIFGTAILLTDSRGPAVKSLAPFLPFLLFAALTIMWSPDQKTSERQLYHLISLMIWMAAVIRWISLPSLLRMTSIINGFIVILSVILAIFVPKIGLHHGTDLVEPSHAGNWRGAFIHKNILGEFAVTSLLLLLRDLKREPPVWKFFFWIARAAAIACIIFSKSSNGILGIACGGAVYALLIYRPTSRPVFLIPATIISLILIYGLSLQAADLASLLGRDSHFSGRTEIWQFAQGIINQRIWVGHGYASADATIGDITSKVLFSSASSLHSGYLDVLFELGAIGMILLSFVVLFVLTRAYFATFTTEGVDRQAIVAYIAIVASACVMAAGESSPFRVVGDGAIGFWLSLIALCQIPTVQRRSAARAAEPSRSSNRALLAVNRA
jgi:O-antigen ligase